MRSETRGVLLPRPSAYRLYAVFFPFDGRESQRRVYYRHTSPHFFQKAVKSVGGMIRTSEKAYHRRVRMLPPPVFIFVTGAVVGAILQTSKRRRRRRRTKLNSTHAGGGKDVIDRVVRVGLEVHGAAGRDPRPLLVVSEDDGCVVSSVALFSSSFLRDDVCERPTPHNDRQKRRTRAALPARARSLLISDHFSHRVRLKKHAPPPPAWIPIFFSRRRWQATTAGKCSRAAPWVW